MEESETRLPVPVVPRSVLIRDFLIFELKVFLDGLADVVMAPVGAIAFVADLLIGGGRSGRLFYSVLRVGERWDRWLSLYQPAQEAEKSGEGLIGASSVGADSLIGHIEELIREGRLPATARELVNRVGANDESAANEPKEPQ